MSKGWKWSTIFFAVQVIVGFSLYEIGVGLFTTIIVASFIPIVLLFIPSVASADSVFAGILAFLAGTPLLLFAGDTAAPPLLALAVAPPYIILILFLAFLATDVTRRRETKESFPILFLCFLPYGVGTVLGGFYSLLRIKKKSPQPQKG